MRGTQPNSLQDIIELSSACTSCHDMESAIVEDWSGTLMAQAGRDPVFYACLDIANHDAPGSGDTCLRCHVPKAWLEGRSTPTDGSMILPEDRESITCNFCHRLVDPFGKPGAPPVDPAILAALGADAPQQSMDLGSPASPGDNGSANYVVDPLDQRRGPFPVRPIGGEPVPGDSNCQLFHSFVVERNTFESALHRRSDICSTCHDVSFPHFSRNDTGDLVFNGSGVPHPNGNKYHMVPEQRTYSEWLKSEFASMGVDMGGRFGGPGQTIVSSCQDCHMPVNDEQGCNFEPARPDKPRHHLSGAATWVLDAIAAHYGPNGPYDPCQPLFSCSELGEATIMQMQANKLRNISMLERAADLTATLGASPNGTPELIVRVTNQTGHKLPTGYPEGRRMWLTVEYFSAADSVNPILVFGGYNLTTGDLDQLTTKVYEAQFGPDPALAAALNRPAAPSSHALLANMRYKDNRIPPRGFTHASFAAVQAEPIAYAYADGQYWDDTAFGVPELACSARVTLYYQATSREYIEFLRDNNPDFGTPDNRGQVAYDLWVQHGGVVPVPMASITVDAAAKGDTDLDGVVNTDDVVTFVAVLLGDETDPRRVCAANVNHDAHVDGIDVQAFADLLLLP